MMMKWWWWSLTLRRLGLGGQKVKNVRRLACKFDLYQSECKSSQVNASAKLSRKQTQVEKLRALAIPLKLVRA